MINILLRIDFRSFIHNFLTISNVDPFGQFDMTATLKVVICHVSDALCDRGDTSYIAHLDGVALNGDREFRGCATQSGKGELRCINGLVGNEETAIEGMLRACAIIIYNVCIVIAFDEDFVDSFVFSAHGFETPQVVTGICRT